MSTATSSTYWGDVAELAGGGDGGFFENALWFGFADFDVFNCAGPGDSEFESLLDYLPGSKRQNTGGAGRVRSQRAEVYHVSPLFFPRRGFLFFDAFSIFFSSSTASEKCWSTDSGNVVLYFSYSISAFNFAVSWVILPAWVRICLSVIRMKSSSLATQSANTWVYGS
jgi:hypothetical protein